MASSSVTGLNSGLQWGDTVKLMMDLERRPVDALETRRATFSSQLTNWSSIEAKLGTLNTAASAIESSDDLLTKSISSSDDTILTATGDSTAIPGSHQVLVNQLATNHIIVHTTGWADVDTTPVNNSGIDQSFSYSYAGENFTVTVPDGTPLTGLVRLINNDPDNEHVNASILNDGSGGATAYHLVLSGEESGEDNIITILDTGPNPTDLGDGDDFDASEWDVTQTAQNAEIRVDGFPDPAWGWPNPWIETESNDVNDIIPGVTLQLLNVTDGTPIQIEVSLNKADVRDKVNTLVKAYNEVITTLNTLTSYDAETKTSGPLAGDSLARSLRSELTDIITSTIPGVDDTDRYRSLGEVGIKLSSGGTVKLDSKKLNDALDIDPTSVARLFVFDSISSTSFVQVSGHGDKTKGGNYAFTMSYDAAGVIDDSGTNTIGGDDANVVGDTIISGAVNTGTEGLLLMLDNPGNGPTSLSGSMRVYTGLAAMLSGKINTLTDSQDGSIKLNRDGIKSQMENLDVRIEAWEARLTKIEESYNRKFSAMESLIGQLKTQSNYLSGI